MNINKNFKVIVGEGKSLNRDGKQKYRVSAVGSTLFVAMFAVIGVILLVGSHASSPFAGSITDYTNSKFMTGLPFGSRNFWDQPSRSYMNTVPASVMQNAVGINMNSTPTQNMQVGRLLSDSGFTHVRTGSSFAAMEYNNPTQINAFSLGSFQNRFSAMKANNLRPVINLYAGDGGPSPYIKFRGNFLVTPKPGDTTIKVDPATAAQIVPNLTGIFQNGVMNGILFTSVNKSTGTVSLSKPILANKTDLTGRFITFKYGPFQRPFLADGKTMNPAYVATEKGWLLYVKALGDLAKSIIGSDQFDFELWNEISFGSSFLNADAYYSSSPDPTAIGSGKDQLLKDTAAFLKDPANGFTNVKLTNGFASQQPFASGANQPAGVDALSKHDYSYSVIYPQALKFTTVRAQNALMQPGYTNIGTGGQNIFKDNFVPTYVDHYPEDTIGGVFAETLIRDLAPFNTSIYGGPHGINTLNAGGGHVGVWETEWGFGLSVPNSRGGIGDPNNGNYKYTNADRIHVQAKADIRHLASFVNKGVTQIDFYASGNGAQSFAPSQFGQIDTGFFDAVNKNPAVYPGDAAGGEIMQTIQRFTKPFANNSPITRPRSLSLNQLDDYSGNVQFKGNGTIESPNLYNRDVFGFYPYQLSNHKFLIPVDVQTLDLQKIYNKSDPAVTKFDMPQEKYRLTIGGVNGNRVNELSLYDPLNNQSFPVTVISRAADNIVIELDATDSPRLLSIGDNGVIKQPKLAPPTVNITSPTGGSTISQKVTIQASATSDPSTNVATVIYKIDGSVASPLQNTPPYNWSFSSGQLLTNGPHVFQAVVQDGTGATAQSMPINVIVNNVIKTGVLKVVVTNPKEGAILSGPISLAAAATPADSNTPVTQVQFILDSKPLGLPVTQAPFTYTFSSKRTTPGVHVMTAEVTDSAGNKATSLPVTFTTK